KPLPLMVNGCALSEPVTGLGLTELIAGVTAGATTWKVNSPEERLPFSTSADQVCAGNVKLGMMTACVAVCELMGRLAKVCPAVLSFPTRRSSDLKPLPLMVNGCALSEPVTGFGLTLPITGVAAGATTGKVNSPEERLPFSTSADQV